ncbi:MAG: insulinase family protein [Firmicutes bacterium]|nr:insulinase family protein [Bacillota bacterium]
MKVNDIAYGFSVKKIREVENPEGRLWQLEHEKSGAQLVWFDNADENKHFSVAFKTPAFDDTGVFHILEHSVLNGSEKYSVKAPFVELLKSSMNTFLNAMTMSDCTIYPVSSRNGQDYLNLASVYLDAVFRTNIYSNPNIFYQEGWHYELQGEERVPAFNGVVFNEMKGAISSPERQLHSGLYRLMFPDNCYGFEAGGNPLEIPKLTYESFLETHTKYYHPSNARFYLDGSVPFEETLELIDSYLSNYDRSGEAIEIEDQAVLRGVRGTGYYQADSEHAYLSFGRIICGHDDAVRRFAIIVLLDYLAENNESPLNKAVLETDIAQDFYAHYDQAAKNQAVYFTAKHIDMEREDEFWEALARVRAEILEKGVDKEELEAIISQLEYAFKELEEPKAIHRNISAITTWLHGGDPMDMIALGEVFARLRELLDTDYYDELVAELPLTAEDSAVYVMLPSADCDEERLKAERAALEKAFEDERLVERVDELCEKLQEWQLQENTSEQLATLPSLPITAVNEEPAGLPTDVKDGVVLHKIADDGVIHLKLYFSLTGTAIEDYSALSLLSNLLGELPTEEKSVAVLRKKMKSIFGFLDFNLSSYGRPGDRENCHPYFVITLGVLEEKLDVAIELIDEIINKTDYDNVESKTHVEDVLVQCFYYMQDCIAAQGNRFARMRAESHVSAAAYVEDAFDGIAFYDWMKAFLDDFDAGYEKFRELMKKAQKEIFCSSNMTITAAVGNDELDLSKLREVFDNGVLCDNPEFINPKLDKAHKSEAIVVPGGISYTALVAPIAAEKANDGRIYALSVLLSYQYLWNEIRVRRGAYGCGFNSAKAGIARFYSYRDPSPAESQQVFAKTSDFLREYCKLDDNFNNILISAASAIEPLISVDKQHGLADKEYFSGISYDDKLVAKKALLGMKKEELLDFCEMFDAMAEDGYVCTIGPQEAVDTMGAELVKVIK